MENGKVGFTLTKNPEDFLEDKINQDQVIAFLVKDIVAKKELNNLDENLVSEKVRLFLAKPNNKNVLDKLGKVNYGQFQRSKEHGELVKKVRAELREIYGVFIMDGYKKRHSLLEELKKKPSLENLEIHNQILALHKSSKERLPYYPVVYKKIFEITGIPKKIIDLACGLNPISYPYIASASLGSKPECIACDLAEKDLEFIQEYFDIMKIKGSVKRIDLTKEKDYANMVADVAFLFKTLDSLEAVEWNISEKVFANLKSKFIVVSFATKSIGGKKTIRKEKRSWFERLVDRQGHSVKTFEIPGEIFYVISKKTQ
jgi:16S rRNA (guanine(1405)-N(7))-methyltransferase